MFFLSGEFAVFNFQFLSEHLYLWSRPYTDVSNSKGFTVFTSYALKRSFARVGLSYGYTVQSVRTLTDAATSYYTYLNFLNINGPNQLDGIRSSTITPSYTYNTVNHPITPTAGKSLSASLQFSGSILGGNVNQIEPQIDAKYFRKGLSPKHVIGMHFSGRFLTGYGGKTAAPFNRFFMPDWLTVTVSLPSMIRLRTSVTS